MDALALDPQTTALVLIDLEHAIVGRELFPRSGGEVVDTCAHLAKAFRAKGSTVVYVHVLVDEILKLPADKSAPAGGTPPNASEIVPEAGLQPGDIVVTKRQWGAFYGTQLDQALRRRGVKTIAIAGIATNMGVESTAREAFDRGYEMVFVEDAMATRAEEMHRFAIEQIFPIMGRVRSAYQVAAALGG